uniref:Uncharacterized protein n=1 Tax=Arundo donax TaxID=35708 RepID=A0A0A9AFG4_ARUDO
MPSLLFVLHLLPYFMVRKLYLKNQPQSRYIFGVPHHVYHLPICSKCIF